MKGIIYIITNLINNNTTIQKNLNNIAENEMN